MTPHRYVVLAHHAKGFESLEDAKRFALANYPAVICERVRAKDGSQALVEVMRHDFLFDEELGGEFLSARAQRLGVSEGPGHRVSSRRRRPRPGP